jgi:hypothetical protein
MIRKKDILLFAALSITCLQALPAQSATYYISPTGSDSNPGTSEKPWLTFSYAISPAHASCGDTLVLKDGTYGDGTRTGKVSVTSLDCTAGNELTLTAENQRQAKISDSGNGYAILIQKSSYIIVDGLYARSTDLAGGITGRPISVSASKQVTIKNSLFRNPNRYANSHTIDLLNSQKILIEDNESYVFHRHCITAWQSSEVVVRRQYCNPRGGRISGGFSAVGAPLGSADSVMSMYPCQNCILENSIADGTTSGIYLNEMNASFGGRVVMSGSKVLGSICYKCNYGNGIYLNARKVADLDHTPQNITIRDVAIIDFTSKAAGIRVSDGVNVTLDHITVLGGGSGVTGIAADDTQYGSIPATNSISMTNILLAGLTGDGFRVTGYDTWKGDKLISYGNRTAFQPPPPSNWANTLTKDHGMGTCKVWVPTGAAAKGTGTSGSDIGANILYRYTNGVLTSTPLWDPRTGEFPHGAADLDGTNRVAGESLFDIHTRLNVNTRACPFPRDYGNSGSDTKTPASPVGLKVS